MQKQYNVILGERNIIWLNAEALQTWTNSTWFGVADKSGEMARILP